MTLTRSHIALLVLVTLLPLPALAQVDATTNQTVTDNGNGTVSVNQNASLGSAFSFQREGIFGCSYNGAYAMSVGAFAAQGGAYVPVSDATVELNTGILVYQQCTLREVIDRMRESVTSALVKQTETALLTGRGGAAMYVQQPTNELTNAMATAALKVLNQWQASSTVPRTVIAGVATAYKTALNSESNLGCPAWVTDDLMKIGVPGCTPFSQYLLVKDQADAVAASRAYDLSSQWLAGGMYYPQEQLDASGNPYTVTPSSLVETIAGQANTSGLRQLENANDIGQMIGALFAGLGSRILSNNQGLVGLAQASAGQPSYLDQLAAESSAGLRNAAVNAAITQLTAAQQAERTYFSILSQIALAITKTINDIRGFESQCWVIVEKSVCTGSSTTPLPYNQCIDGNGTKLTIATSTAYSQAIVGAQIAPVATSTATALIQSQNTLNQINQLIAGVTNTTSLDAQRIAIQQLEGLITGRQLHSQPDITALQGQQSAISTMLQNLETSVPTTWGDGAPNLSNPSDPNSGWCNVKNPAVVQMWDQLWQR